jgi:hypothetical protein
MSPMLATAIHWGLAAMAPFFKAASSPGAVGQAESSDFVFYQLDVAFTPYGPEILSFWMPVSIAPDVPSELKRGDLA